MEKLTSPYDIKVEYDLLEKAKRFNAFDVLKSFLKSEHHQYGISKDIDVGQGSAYHIINQLLDFGYIESLNKNRGKTHDKIQYRLTGEGLYFLIQTRKITYDDFEHYKERISKIEAFHDENWQFLLNHHLEMAFYLMKVDIEGQEKESLEDVHLYKAHVELLCKEVDDYQYKEMKKGAKYCFQIRPTNPLRLLFKGYRKTEIYVNIHDPKDELKEFKEIELELSSYIIAVLKELRPRSLEYLHKNLANILKECKKHVKRHKDLIKLIEI